MLLMLTGLPFHLRHHFLHRADLASQLDGGFEVENNSLYALNYDCVDFHDFVVDDMTLVLTLHCGVCYHPLTLQHYACDPQGWTTLLLDLTTTCASLVKKVR